MLLRKRKANILKANLSTCGGLDLLETVLLCAVEALEVKTKARHGLDQVAEYVGSKSSELEAKVAAALA